MDFRKWLYWDEFNLFMYPYALSHTRWVFLGGAATAGGTVGLTEEENAPTLLSGLVATPETNLVSRVFAANWLAPSTILGSSCSPTATKTRCTS